MGNKTSKTVKITSEKDHKKGEAPASHEVAKETHTEQAVEASECDRAKTGEEKLDKIGEEKVDEDKVDEAREEIATEEKEFTATVGTNQSESEIKAEVSVQIDKEESGKSDADQNQDLPATAVTASAAGPLQEISDPSESIEAASPACADQEDRSVCAISMDTTAEVCADAAHTCPTEPEAAHDIKDSEPEHKSHQDTHVEAQASPERVATDDVVDKD